MLLAATSIGASHLVLSPRAGLLYGSALLWLVLAAHLFKYPAFEFGPRYALATGESLLAGYARVPGPRNWALIGFAVFTALQGIGVALAVTSITAAVLTVAVGGLPFAVWGVVVISVAALLLVVGRFPALETINKLMMATLALVTVVAFCAHPPAAGQWSHLVRPTLPEGSIVLVAALVGWLPTGIDVSIWHSLWALEVRDRWRPVDSESSLESGSSVGGQERAKADRRQTLRNGLLDMRCGYGLSFGLAVCFLLLGAQLASSLGTGGGPAPSTDGAHMAVVISEAYAAVLGPWIVPAFLVAAFFAMFSTTYVVLDGFPRALSEALRLLVPARRDGGWWSTPYWALIGGVWLAVSAILLLVGEKPILLTTLAALLSLAVSPVYYSLNYWCVTRGIADPALRPSRWLRGLSWAGILFVSAAAVLSLYLKLG